MTYQEQDFGSAPSSSFTDAPGGGGGWDIWNNIRGNIDWVNDVVFTWMNRDGSSNGSTVYVPVQQPQQQQQSGSSSTVLIIGGVLAMVIVGSVLYLVVKKS